MEYITCTTCDFKYKMSEEYNHKLTNKHLAAGRKYYCQQCKKIINLADQKDNLESEEHKKKL